MVSAALAPADAQTVRSLGGGTWSSTSTLTPAAQAGSSTAYGGTDPSTWSDHRLAAQLVVSCVDLGSLDAARRQARAGIGGIVLLGSRPPNRLRDRLTAVRDAAPTAVLPFVASDEEGGAVQRLRTSSTRCPRPGRWAAGARRGSAGPPTTTRCGCGGSVSGWTSPRWPTCRCPARTSRRWAGPSPATPTG